MYNSSNDSNVMAVEYGGELNSYTLSPSDPRLLMIHRGGLEKWATELLLEVYLSWCGSDALPFHPWPGTPGSGRKGEEQSKKSCKLRHQNDLVAGSALLLPMRIW